MWRNCSTRDGRARAAAPVHPHVAWTTQLPFDGKQLGSSYLATGAAGEVYAVTTENFADIGVIRRFRAVDGAPGWEQPITPDSTTAMPVIRQTGVLDLFAYSAQTQEVLLEIDAATGAPHETTFGFDLYDAPPHPAVGADGSLYLAHLAGVGTADSRSYLSRVRPDGTVAWTTPDLATLVPPELPLTNLFSPSVIALGDGLVVTVLGGLASAGSISIVLALDAPSGAVRWRTTQPGQLLGGPAIRPDGAVTILTEIVRLEAASGAAHPLSFAGGMTEIFAITRDNITLVGSNAGDGVDGLLAIDDAGKTLWSAPGAIRSAVIAADGTILSSGATIRGLDPATGAVRWELLPPTPSSCLFDIALTSDGGLVGLQCDGTLFGARD
jgi:outer membrane protein assembly factor BamB